MSAVDLLLQVLDGGDEFEGYQQSLLSSNSVVLVFLLNKLVDSERFSSVMHEWMKPHALNLICKMVDQEIESSKPDLKMSTAKVMPEFIEQWDITKLMGAIAQKTPTWSVVLQAATESRSSKNQSATLKSRNRVTV
jgi:hypothetical protein